MTASPASRIINLVSNLIAATKPIWFALGTIGLGLFLGILLTSPLAELIVSFAVIGLHLAIVVIEPLSGLLLWLIGQPFTDGRFIIPLGKGIPDLSLMRLTTILFCTWLLAQMVIGKRKMPILSKVDLAFLLFLPAYALSMLGYSGTSGYLRLLLDRYFIPYLVYFIVRNLTTDRAALDRILHALLIIGVYTALYATYEQLTGNILFFDTSAGEKLYYSENLRILRGIYGNNTTFGVVMNLVIPIDLYYFLKARSMGRKTFYASLLAIMLVGIFYTYKRTAWISLLLSFLIMQIFNPQVRKFFITLLLIFAVVWVFKGDEISQSELAMERVSEDFDTAHGRTDLWAEGFALWKQAPIWGHGFQGFGRRVENYYIGLLVKAGLMAFIPYIGWLFFTLQESAAVFRQMGWNKELFVDRGIIIGFWGGLSAFLASGYTASGFESNSIIHLILLVLIGVVASQRALLVHEGQ